MKKLLLILVACISFLAVYGQTINGEKIVCPKKSYTYTYTLSSAATRDIGVSIFSNSGATSTSFYTIKKGESKFTFNVIWDDIPTPFASITVTPTDGITKTVTLQNITIASIGTGTKPTYFSSTPAASNGIIKIPLGQAGVLSMTVDPYLYYPNLNNNDSYKITDYKWTVGAQSIETKNKHSINYGAADLNQTAITVTAVGNACAKAYGGSISYKIERYFDLQIKSNSGANACPNTDASFSLQGIVPQGLVIEWIAGSNCTLVSGQGTVNATFRIGSANTKAIVKAKVTYAGFNATFENSAVWVGIPGKPNILASGSTSLIFPGRNMSTFTAVADGVDRINGFTFSISGAASIIRELIGGEVTIETSYVTYDSPFTLGIIACNKCGKSPISYINGTVKGSGDGVIPPMTEKSTTVSDNQPEIKSVKIYNLSGVLVYSDNAINGNFDIKSTSLTDGIYIIKKFDGQNKTSEKVMLKR